MRRVDLAQAVARLLAADRAREPAAANAWRTPRVRFTDLAAGHLAYPAASAGGRVRRDDAPAPTAAFSRRGPSPARKRSRRSNGSQRWPTSLGAGERAAMTALTPANQLTLLRMLLIPAFVILVVYGYLGWALDRVRHRRPHRRARRPDRAAVAARRRSLGAWLDPMADKLLLVSTFVVLTLPGLGLANRAADLADRAASSAATSCIVADGGDRQPRDRPAHVPAVDLRQDRDRHLHRDRRRRDVLQLPRLSLGARRRLVVYASLAITLVSGLHYIWHAARIIEAPSTTCDAWHARDSRSRSRAVVGCIAVVGVLVAGSVRRADRRRSRPSSRRPPARSSSTSTPRRRRTRSAYFIEARAGRAATTGRPSIGSVKYGMVQGGDPLSKDPAKREPVRHRRPERREGRGARAEDDARLGGRGPRAGTARQRRRAVLRRPRRSAGARRPVHRVRPGLRRHGGRCRRSPRRRSTQAGLATERVEITPRHDPRHAAPEPFVTETAAGAGRLPRGARHERRARSRSSSFPTRRPNTCASSCGSPRPGVYNGMAFHRVAPGFVIQTGALQHAARRRSPRSSRSSCTTCRRSSTTRST